MIAGNGIAVAAFTWPFVLPAASGENTAHSGDAPWITLILSICLGLLLAAQLGRPGLGAKRIALMGVLAAAMVLLRLPGFVSGFSAMFIIVLVAGNAFGPGFGFTLGATGTLASALFVGGLGPWVPFQMAAIGWVGAGAGLLPRKGSWRLRVTALAAYAVVSGYLFGAIMNLWFWPFLSAGTSLGWAPALGAGENFTRYARFYLLESAAWDTARAIGNAALVIVRGRPLLGALDRAARKMRLEIHP